MCRLSVHLPMIKWITEQLGTASYYEYERLPGAGDLHLVDVRELVDGMGNDPRRLRAIIDGTVQQLRSGKRVVICCDQGVSRSNAIALGTLLAVGMDYEQALRRVVQDFGNANISLGVLADVRELYKSGQRQRTNRSTRILITGTTGFIGRAVLRAMGDEYDFVSLDRSQYDLCRDLLLLDALVERHGIDTIFHLAHPRLRSTIPAMGESLMMMKTVIELCRVRGLRLVYLSSLVVFGGHVSADSVQAGATLRLCPKGVYGETKCLCEQLIRFGRESSSLDAIVLRPAAVYGPDMERSTIFAKFFERAVQGRAIRTHQYRNGRPAFDFVFIDDVIDAIRRALDARPVTPVNIGTGLMTTTYDLASMIVRIAGSPSMVESVEVHDETSRIVVDAGKAARQLGWTAKVNLETGLRMVWDSIRQGHVNLNP